MRAILHIGIGKTGTSAIQKTLAENRDLLSSAGWLYPETVGRKTGRHDRLGAYALKDSVINDVRKLLQIDSGGLPKFRADLERDLLAEIERAKDQGASAVLLSDEGLCSLRELEEIKSIKAFLDKFFNKIEVIIYLRRQDLHSVSQYSQHLKVGRATMSILRRMHFYMFDVYIDKWAQVFGSENLKPRIFERSQLPNGDVVDDFLQVAGIEMSTNIVRVGDLNESLNTRAALFLLELNSRVENAADVARRTGQMAIVRHLLDAFPGKGLKPSRAEAEKFMEIYAEPNERVRERWFPDQETLFSNSYDMYPDVSEVRRLAAEELADMALEILASLSNDHAKLKIRMKAANENYDVEN